MINVAVILSGCGYRDGSEIHEAVITLLELDKAGARVSCFAPDINQKKVVNHLTGKEQAETRNVLVESARIARGHIQDLATLDAHQFDALVLPGGFGAALNLSDLAIKGKDATILPDYKRAVLAFLNAKKPIGAICISPAVLVAALADKASIKVTIGDDTDNLIANLGGIHQPCDTPNAVFDATHHIVSCSAYMRDAPLKEVAAGIEKVIQKTLEQAKDLKLPKTHTAR